MKIVCGSCGAKYSIADEKVQGKVFKIRCRKCSNVIVVKGNAEEEAQADAVGVAGSSQSGTQEWYVVIDGEQAGPLSADDVESYFIQGRINGESYIWRDGMADWTTLFGVDAFMHLNNNAYGEDDATMVAQSPLQSPVAGAFVGSGQDDFDESEDATAVVSTEAFHQFEQQQQQQDPFQDQTSQETFGADMGFGSESSADPFAAQDGGYNSGLDAGMGASLDSGYAAAGFQEQPASSLDFNSTAGNDPGLGFGAASAGGAGLASFDSSASTGGDDGMFAAFDSNNNFDNNGSLAYQSFAGLNGSNNSDLDFGSATAAPAQTADNSNAMIGQRNENSVLFSLSSLNSVEAVKGPANNDASANTEGSGLIDIQALASSHQQLNASRNDAAAMPSPETFSPGTMSVPAIMPARGSHRSNKGLIIGVAVGVVALLGVGIAAIVMLSNRDNNKQPQQVVIKEKVIVKEKVIDNTKNDDKAKQEADDAAKKALAAKTPPATDEKEDEKSTKSTKSTRRTKRGSKSTKTKSTDSGSKTTKTAKKSSKKGVDSLLDSLDNNKKPTKTATKEDSKPAANLPKKLSKPQVQSTFRKYNGRIRTCSRSKNSGKLSGTLWVRVTIESSGKISSASVDSKSSKFKGTDVGRCVVGVVKSMRFPASQSKLSFSYPLII